ncbi:MAG: hypothetical protein O3A39_00655 [Proteobacteria bacterium]|jgi:hypothetical protein|nr:hypothetical protein [Pseudomonadota bacterium]MDA1135116.1 hypothetical protein [Pseudomonadota bacterium]
MRKSKLLITISHYNKRDKINLINLINSLTNEKCDLFIVINDDNCKVEQLGYFYNVQTLTRPNTGMNIGSWNAAYLNNKDYDFYLFLQDECKILEKSFIACYINELSKKEVGMTGESINNKWDNKWDFLANSRINYVVGYDMHKKPVYRVQYYFNLLKTWLIQPGENGRHLRSLIWGFKKETLNKISSFPIGKTKEECIVAEIAVSKKVEQIGLKVTQVHKKPFKYISHIEWKLDGTSKI